jgi:uncharacterized protein (TIGR00255 family)
MAKHTTLNSMTGFARTTGQWRDLTWVWELKSVNGKALDIRFRLPPGFDAVETPARNAASAKLKRGNVQVNLAVSNQSASGTIRVNEELLSQLIVIAERVRERINGPALQAEQLLSLRGVLESEESKLTEDEIKERDAAIVSSFDAAVVELVSVRLAEGARLTAVMQAQFEKIAALTEAARSNPSRMPDATRARIAAQVEKLIGQADSLDPQRLHQEAILVATRADIQEELDRLQSHIAAAQALMKSTEPVGRKFDFLAQEFNREANTLCSKANDPTLTNIGLDLKTVVDQMREQVQNIE